MLHGTNPPLPVPNVEPRWDAYHVQDSQGGWSDIILWHSIRQF